jgi:hypothetical protein
MVRLSDHLTRLAVTVSSPDGRLTAEVRHPDRIAVRFGAGAYRSYRPDALSHQLALLATLTWTRYRRGYLAVLDEYLGGLIDDGDADPQDREYWHRLTDIAAAGRSAGGEVAVRSRALVHWEFDIGEGALNSLREHEFVAELCGAVHMLVADYRARLILLTDEVYGLGLPAWRRAGARAPGRVR